MYENLLNGCELVESQYVIIIKFPTVNKNFACLLFKWFIWFSLAFRLLSCVTEHLTAEIVQLTVSDITRAIEWMKCSYLYVRMKKACIVRALLEENFLDILSSDYFLETFYP